MIMQRRLNDFCNNKDKSFSCFEILCKTLSLNYREGKWWKELVNKRVNMDREDHDIIKYLDKEFKCSLAFTLHLIGDKYKSLILFHLKDGPERSGVLQKSITNISNRMFTYSIRALEKDQLVKRTVYPVTPPKVEYELTEKGRTLIPIILQMDQWGQEFAKKHHLYAPAE